MKIQINYDLLNKVIESKKGFSISQITKYAGRCTAISTVIDIGFSCIMPEPAEKLIFDILFYSLFHAALGTALYKGLSELGKRKATRDLIVLAFKLCQLNIITNLNQIDQAYAYHTDYKIVNSKKGIPQLKQDKYIVLPVYENGEESEVSILQEHIIGTRKYDLSIGEPQKELKLVPRAI